MAIVIWDDDDAPQEGQPAAQQGEAGGQNGPQVALQQAAATPEVTISYGGFFPTDVDLAFSLFHSDGAVLPVVAEGEGIAFTVSRTGYDTTNPLTVNLTVSESGNDMVAAGNEGDKTVTIPAGAASATLTIPTVNDGTFEDNSDVTVSVTFGAGYSFSPGSKSNSATIPVIDDDVKSIKVEPTGAVSLNTVQARYDRVICDGAAILLQSNPTPNSRKQR